MSHRLPSKEQCLYSQMMIVEALLEHLRSNLASGAFDNLELLSDMDKTRLCVKVAINRMETILKSVECKSVCC